MSTRPCHFSGGFLRLLLSRVSCATSTLTSPVLLLMTVPQAPTKSPGSSVSYTSRCASSMARGCSISWILPDSSLTSTKTRLPLSLRKTSRRPATQTDWPLSASNLAWISCARCERAQVVGKPRTPACSRRSSLASRAAVMRSTPSRSCSAMPARSRDLENLEGEGARGGDHGDLVAHAFADQRATDRRLVRDQAAARVGLVRPHQVVGLLLTLGIDHLDVASHAHVVGLGRRLFDDFGRRQQPFELLNATLHERLLGFRLVVFGVVHRIAEFFGPTDLLLDFVPAHRL